MNIVHGIAVTINVTAGLFQLYFRHGHFAIHAAIQFGVAGFIIGLNIWAGIAGRKVARMRARLRDLQIAETEMRLMSDTDRIAASQKAIALLHRIVKATGATITEGPSIVDPAAIYGGLTVQIHIGGADYIILVGHIYRIREGIVQAGTCYHPPMALPWGDCIASALLLLKNDPSIFERWQRQDQYYS